MTENNKPDEDSRKDVPPEKEHILLNWLIILAGTAVILLGAVWYNGGMGGLK